MHLARFQSTLPARGATHGAIARQSQSDVSIHAPRAGSDQGGSRHRATSMFQSTLPARGATYAPTVATACRASVSIHAPRAGSDELALGKPSPADGFNPRSPRGERHVLTAGQHAPQCSFNPRSPRGERRWRDQSVYVEAFQSTLPARGATRECGRARGLSMRFNPRSPRGERRVPMCRLPFESACFNPRSPRGERPDADARARCARSGFNPRSPRGERPAAMRPLSNASTVFQSTLPARGATALSAHRA